MLFLKRAKELRTLGTLLYLEKENRFGFLMPSELGYSLHAYEFKEDWFFMPIDFLKDNTIYAFTELKFWVCLKVAKDYDSYTVNEMNAVKLQDIVKQYTSAYFRNAEIIVKDVHGHVQKISYEEGKKISERKDEWNRAVIRSYINSPPRAPMFGHPVVRTVLQRRANYYYDSSED
jgi:hypothetical protein